MDADSIEKVERTVMSLVTQSLKDYWENAVNIFREETDQPQDIAEDLTREAISSMGVSSTNDRLYGKVDVKKAIYAFVPNPLPVALMLDAKAEKRNGDNTATIQMSQTSMRVKLLRKGEALDMPGKLDTSITLRNRKYHVATVIAKYSYDERKDNRSLSRIIIACIPNGKLQAYYNPDAKDTIWQVGRDAPSLNEDFRVRVSFSKLKKKASWRVQTIPIK